MTPEEVEARARPAPVTPDQVRDELRGSPLDPATVMTEEPGAAAVKPRPAKVPAPPSPELYKKLQDLVVLGIREPKGYEFMPAEDLKKWIAEREVSEDVRKRREDLGKRRELARAKEARHIRVDGERIRDITDRVLTAVLAANSPPWIFVRSGSLCRVAVDEEGTPRAHPLDEHGVKFVLERAADFYEVRVRKKKVEEDVVSPTGAVVQDFMNLLEWPGLPPLAGITESPALLRDNTLLTEAGYDPASRLYYVPAPGFTLPSIPETPGPEEVRAAAALLAELFQDFPFDGEASRANTIAALLTAVLRPMIPGPCPLGIFDKPQAGTGATLIARTISALALGREAQLQTPPGSEEEWGKVILTLLIAGRPIVIFDNLEGKMYAGALAACLTSHIFAGRLLGVNREASVPNRAVWLATGNNVQLGGDLPRRCYWIRMDAKTARPWQREGFTHELPGWALQERGQILAAIFTLARAWLQAGRPVPGQEIPRLGSFEGWRDTIGGILQVAGIPGFLGNLEAMYELSDQDTQQWEAFLAALASAFPKGFTVAEVVRHIEGEVYQAQPRTCQYCAGTGNSLGRPCPSCNGSGKEEAPAGGQPPLGDSLPDEVTGKKGDLKRLLGKALARKVDRVYPSGRVVRKAGELMRAVVWKIM